MGVSRREGKEWGRALPEVNKGSDVSKQEIKKQSRAGIRRSVSLTDRRL